MNSSQTYEKIVKAKQTGKHLAKSISLIMSYALVIFFWITIAVFNAAIIVPIALLGALTSFVLISVTHKYIFLEYEYSFLYGRLGISKIYGKSKRKAMIETEMRDLLIIAPASEENIAKAERFEIEDRVIAVSSEAAENIWLTVTGGKDERRILIFFEADERSLSLLRTANPHVFSKQ